MAGVDEEPLGGGGSTPVHRRGDVVLRPARPWSATVLALLAHLERAGFGGAPRLAGAGWSADGREALVYVPGSVPEEPWSPEGAYGVGVLLRDLHRATATFDATGATWFPWWGRDLPGDEPVVGHCDAAPWTVVARDGLPVALVDWDTAGPVDARWELAQAVWLNARLHDGADLPAAAALARAVCDGYGLVRARRADLVDAMAELAVRSAAQESYDAGVSRDGVAPRVTGTLGGGPPLTGHDLLWSMTWRTRDAAWLLRHRAALAAALGA
jgi:Ser/Thr protein kinase RdoA (MazF antagonist)